MKKIYLLLACAFVTVASNAQLTLSGTSYTQNFDNITTAGLPSEWSVYSGAGLNFIGNLSSLNTITTSDPPSMLRPDTSCIGNVVVGGFKNFPSADVCHPGDDNCASGGPSSTYTNRALGVRQVSPTNATHPNLDSGAAFVLNIASTTGFYNFRLGFKLQSLDTASPRVTRWRVDYAIGSPSSFTSVVLNGDSLTGGNSFKNSLVLANFGHLLDNLSSPIWIRVVTLVYSSGSGNRPSSAIDDYNLTWTTSTGTTGINNVNGQQDLELNVIGAVTPDQVTLGFVAEAGNYDLHFYDFTGRNIYSEVIHAETGAHRVNINNLHLAPGMYFARLNNGSTSSVAKVIVQ